MMTVKDKLALADAIRKRNDARIAVFLALKKICKKISPIVLFSLDNTTLK